jgi:hypothetical protein
MILISKLRHLYFLSPSWFGAGCSRQSRCPSPPVRTPMGRVHESQGLNAGRYQKTTIVDCITSGNRPVPCDLYSAYHTLCRIMTPSGAQRFGVSPGYFHSSASRTAFQFSSNPISLIPSTPMACRFPSTFFSTNSNGFSKEFVNLKE